MYAELIYMVFLEGTIHRNSNDWLLPIIHQSILHNGAKKTYETMNKNFMFFHIFPIVINSKAYSNIERLNMIGDAWNIFFNPRLKLISPLRYYGEYLLKFMEHE